MSGIPINFNETIGASMTSTQRSRKTSFIRWHERQLYTSFAWLVTCILTGFLIVTILEFAGFDRPGIEFILTLLSLYLIGMGAVEAFRRFWVGLTSAQTCANRATCEHCRSYGLFDVIENTRPIYARCRKCDHQWVINY